MSDLRAELMAGSAGLDGSRLAAGASLPGIPPFRMLLPPGWQWYDLSAETEQSLVGAARRRLIDGGRPDLVAPLTEQVRDALRGLRSQEAFLYAVPGEGSPTWALGAASLMGLHRRATPYVTLDDIVEDAVRNLGGIAIGDQRRIVRWTDRRPVRTDEGDIISLLIHYLLPVPGTRRLRAIQWTASIAHDPELTMDDPRLLAWLELFDNHLATFAWTAD